MNFVQTSIWTSCKTQLLAKHNTQVNIKPFSTYLHLSAIHFRIHFIHEMVTFKAYLRLPLDYISHLINPYEPEHSLWSACRGLLVIPRSKTKNPGTPSSRSQGHSTSCVSSFKSLLTTNVFIFQNGFVLNCLLLFFFFKNNFYSFPFFE